MGHMTKIKKILVFGNPLVEKDSIPLKLLEKLRKEFPDIQFKEFDTVEDLQNEGRNLIILDAVERIDRVKIIKNIEDLATKKICSLHDFDLAYSLKLMKKMNKINNVLIIGIPMKIKIQDAFDQVKSVIKSI